jgi:tetratricopeptide (TPR) repeat protein
LDEFEKAGDEFEQFILAIYSAAKERMGNNLEVDFSDCIFLMPCNLGMSEIAQKSKSRYGFVPPQIDTTSELNAIINRRYPIEVVNRFDEVCVYGKLSSDDINAILGLHIAKVQKRVDQALGDSSFTIVVEESARKRLLELCLNDRGDVADLKRVVPRHLTDPISVAVETGAIGSGDELIVSCEEGKAICFDRKGKGPVKKLDSTKLSTNTAEAPAKEQEAAAPARSVNAEARALFAKATQLPIEKKKEAIDLLKKALGKLESQPDAVLSVHIYNRIGFLLDDKAQSADYYVDAINARTALTSNEGKDSIPVSLLYANLAMSLNNIGHKDRARGYVRRGMQQIRQHRNSETLHGLIHFITTGKMIAPDQAGDLSELASSLMELRD